MCEDKFDEVIEFLKEKYDASDPIVSEIIEMVMDDVFKDYPTDHLGTFAEIKSVDRVNTSPLPNSGINRLNYKWTTVDIQEAIKKAKEENYETK